MNEGRRINGHVKTCWTWLALHTIQLHCREGCSPPLFLLTGKINFLDAIGEEENCIKLRSEGIENEYTQRISAVWQARREMARLDAKHVLEVASRSSLRTGANTTYEIGSGVKIWNPSEKRWIAGQRVVADSGRNLIIESGAKLRKVPRQWVQPLQSDVSPVTEAVVLKEQNTKEGNQGLKLPQESSTGSGDGPKWSVPKKKYGLRSGLVEGKLRRTYLTH